MVLQENRADSRSSEQGGRGHDQPLRGVAHEDGRGQHLGRLDLGIVLRPEGTHHEEGGAALRVANVVQRLLPGQLQDIVDHGRQIDGTDLVPAEFPEIGMLHVQPRVVPRVEIAAGIAQPDIVAGVHKVVRQCVLRPIEQEAIRATEQAVHDERHRTPLGGIVQPRRVRDAEHIQDIAVRSLHEVRFGRVPMRFNALRLQRKSELKSDL